MLNTRVVAPVLTLALIAGCSQPVTPGDDVAEDAGADAARDTRRAVDVQFPDRETLLDGTSPGDDAALDAPTPGDGPAATDVNTDAGRDVVILPCATCSAYSTPVTAATMMVPALTEQSGVVASRAHPGVLYGENDSGDMARFFAFTEAGVQLGEFRLIGAINNDWEDIAIGPCADGTPRTCVFLGDIGDNRKARAEYTIFRVVEPEVDVDHPVGTVNLMFDRLAFTFPDGTHNSETLLSDPTSGSLYVVTRDVLGASRAYRMAPPFATDATAVVTFVANVPVPMTMGISTTFTGGDVHPCGNRMLLRTYDRLFEYRGLAGASIETLFTMTPREVPLASEVKGEAVGYRYDGRGYWTVSEGVMQNLSVTNCM